MMASFEYTRFPNLSSFEAESLGNAKPSNRQLRDFRASPQHVYLAWAWLLCAHTGEEHAVFETDDAMIHIDTGSWNISSEEKSSSRSSTFHHTGVFFNPVSYTA
jgi:hypothetical protein